MALARAWPFVCDPEAAFGLRYVWAARYGAGAGLPEIGICHGQMFPGKMFRIILLRKNLLIMWKKVIFAYEK